VLELLLEDDGSGACVLVVLVCAVNEGAAQSAIALSAAMILIRCILMVSPDFGRERDLWSAAALPSRVPRVESRFPPVIYPLSVERSRGSPSHAGFSEKLSAMHVLPRDNRRWLIALGFTPPSIPLPSSIPNVTEAFRDQNLSGGPKSINEKRSRRRFHMVPFARRGACC
jgi:hypothetical protein